MTLSVPSNHPARAILWLAVSSAEQAASEDKESLKAQERDLRAIAENKGWDIIDVLRVPGHSRNFYTFREFAEAAAAEGITAPLRMLDHWQDRDFDIFACRDGSRFGRKQSIFAEVVERTLDSGAVLYTLADELIDDSKSNKDMPNYLSFKW